MIKNKQGWVRVQPNEARMLTRILTDFLTTNMILGRKYKHTQSIESYLKALTADVTHEPNKETVIWTTTT